MTIDPRLVIQMLAISQYGSISRAAAALHMSQPALSNGVALLERQLGVRVLERSRHGSKLTEYGEAVARCADAVDSHINNLMADVRARSKGSAGTLRLGVTPIAGYTFVPEAIADLAELMPGLAISMKEAPDDQLSELLESGKIDLAICPIGTGPAQSAILEEGLFTDPFSLVLRKGHELSRATTVSIADVIDEQWILPHPGSAFRRQVEAIFLTCGFPVPADSINTNSSAMLEKLLLRTDRIAIMSDWYVRSLDRTKYSRVALRHIGAPRTIGFRRLRNVQLSPSADTFVEIMRRRAAASVVTFCPPEKSAKKPAARSLSLSRSDCK